MTLREYILDKVDRRNPLPYDVFNEIVTFAIPKFKFTSIEEASKKIIDELKELGISVGTQEVTLQERWPGQQRSVPFGKGSPGFLAEPMNSHHANVSFKVGDYVVVEADTWRDKFEGIIRNIKNMSVDVEDCQTGVLYEDLPIKLISKPLAKGRPIAPPQYRRVGDPLGLMDSPRDVGDTNMVRTWPSEFFPPMGQENDTVVNPSNVFFTSLTDEAKRYLEGKEVSLSAELILELNKKGLIRLT